MSALFCRLHLPVPVQRNLCVEQPPRAIAVIMISVFIVKPLDYLANLHTRPRIHDIRLQSYHTVPKACSFCGLIHK